MSTLVFAHHCKKLFKNDIDRSTNKICLISKENEIFNQLIKNADIVILAINWNLHQYKKSYEVFQELKNIVKGKIMFLGIKDFGNVQIRNLVKVPIQNRKDVVFKPSEKFVEINSYLVKTLGQFYLDVFKPICKKNSECPLFNLKGELLSYDGKHLTKRV